MKPDESAIPANQRVGWDSGPGGNLTLDAGYREEYRVRFARPVGSPARRTFKARTCTFKCGAYSLNVVLTSVSFHGRSFTEAGGAA
jgi:hypothetical protein